MPTTETSAEPQFQVEGPRLFPDETGFWGVGNASLSSRLVWLLFLAMTSMTNRTWVDGVALWELSKSSRGQ